VSVQFVSNRSTHGAPEEGAFLVRAVVI